MNLRERLPTTKRTCRGGPHSRVAAVARSATLHLKIPAALLALCLASSCATTWEQPGLPPRGDQAAAEDRADPEELFQLANRYNTGKGLKQSHKQALSLFCRAAAKGHVKAAYQTGYMYQYGHGTAKNLGEALKWYRRAAAGGLVDAMYNIGYIHFTNPKRSKKDSLEALQQFRQAADKGHAPAMTNLGKMLLHGIGCQEDSEAALKWLNLAAEKGQLVAMFHLGQVYRLGQGVERDFAKAHEWYRKAAEKGDARSMVHMAKLWLKQAADKADPEAIFIYGLMFEYGLGGKVDLRKAKALYKLAAAVGSAQAAKALNRLEKK